MAVHKQSAALDIFAMMVLHKDVLLERSAMKGSRVLKLSHVSTVRKDIIRSVTVGRHARNAAKANFRVLQNNSTKPLAKHVTHLVTTVHLGLVIQPAILVHVERIQTQLKQANVRFARKVFTNLNQAKPAARNVQLECFYLIKAFRQ
jgi:hypothetical protein